MTPLKCFVEQVPKNEYIEGSAALQFEASASTGAVWEQNIDKDDNITVKETKIMASGEAVRKIFYSTSYTLSDVCDAGLGIILRTDRGSDISSENNGDASGMNIELLKKYLESETEAIRMEFIADILELILKKPEHLMHKEIVELVSAWVETAEICLDSSLMEDIAEAEEQLKSGDRGTLWAHPENTL